MNVDWLNFTPLSALLGGALIGLSAAIFILLNGRIAGISGIMGGLLKPANKTDALWRGAFVAGLLLAPWLYQRFSPLPESTIDTPWPVLIVAGFLVGFGSRLGSGCTSGHGVCGISRLSTRSIVATLTFMATGGITVLVVRHLAQ